MARLRAFFRAFFALDAAVWAGFLGGWPGLPGNERHESWHGRLRFGLSLFLKLPPRVQLAMMGYAVRDARLV